MDDYDEDDWDRMFRSDDDLYDEEEEDEGEAVVEPKLTDAEIREMGSLDGGSDAQAGNPRYSGYGLSVDLDELTDEQEQEYEEGYGAGWDSSKDWDEDEEI